ncbi:unnamed protein product [Paramecium pentaurelia]|uniref:CCHC-type domain-containing protein n=1 Tax=Paramecium pentaurelia TaxID=43138 RepID=A0A8S1TV24_9CILI|nr:unnamed protein product [Paramecium pentaurelia]
MSIWQEKCILDYHIQQQIKLDALEELYQKYKQNERRISKQNQKYEKRKKYKNKKKKKKSSSSSSSSSSTSSNFQKITSSSESDSLPSLPSNFKQNKKHEKYQTKILDFTFDINPPKGNYLIEYELNGQKKMTCMQNLNEKIQKLNIQSQQIQNDDDKNEMNDDNNLKQDLKDELELGVNRYYQYNPFEYCYRCKQTGHQERQCTEQQNIQCNYCLSQKHVGDVCSNVSCFRCNQIGHRKYDCKFQLKFQKCINCGKNSHNEQDCGILVQLINNQKEQIQCLVCRNYGHINCQNIII